MDKKIVLLNLLNNKDIRVVNSVLFDANLHERTEYFKSKGDFNTYNKALAFYYMVYTGGSLSLEKFIEAVDDLLNRCLKKRQLKNIKRYIDYYNSLDNEELEYTIFFNDRRKNLFN